MCLFADGNGALDGETTACPMPRSASPTAARVSDASAASSGARASASAKACPLSANVVTEMTSGHVTSRIPPPPMRSRLTIFDHKAI